MDIKALILDLDDTLFDCTGQLVRQARKRAAKALAEAIGKPSEEIHQKLLQYAENAREDIFERLLDEYRVFANREEILEKVQKAYNSDEVEAISLFSDALETLKTLKKSYTLILVTSGTRTRQEKKIELLGLKPYFSHIFIHDMEKGESREELFKEALQKAGVQAEETISVGDRIFSEIKIGNRLGMGTIRMLHGRFKNLVPKSELEEPDTTITSLSELPAAVKKITSGKKGKRIVAIGGGTGLPNVLKGLKKHTDNVTAVVTVTDSGRSSGQIRKDLRVLPPGDIRNCLVALSESDELMKKIFQYRFDKGELKGTSLGNLFIASLAEITGSFEQALKESSRILNIKGKVFPSTYTDVHIHAELEDGTHREEEMGVRALGKPPIKKVFLQPEAEAAPEVLEEIREADVIVLGPGSFYTSIITNLLPKGIAHAIAQSPAKKVYISNIMTQPGQTDNFTFSQHVNILEHYLGTHLDYVLVNSKQAPTELLETYKKEGAELVVMDKEKLTGKAQIIETDLLEQLGDKRSEWEKEDFLRHDPEKLAQAILQL